MSKIRKVRDINTGISYFIDIESGEPVHNRQKGEGIMNSLISTAKKALTSKTTKNLAKKIAIKGAEKGAQHVAQKAVNNKLKKETKKEIKKIVKPIVKPKSENKGEMIVSLLQSHPKNKKYQPERTKKTEKQLMNDILSIEFDKLIDM